MKEHIHLVHLKVKFDQYGYAYLTLANIASIN